MAPLLQHRPALALLAVWTTGTIVLGWRRPVRTQEPVEKPGSHLPMMLTLLFLPLLIPPISAWGEAHRVLLLPGGAALAWAGVVMAALGLALRIAAMLRLGSRFSPVAAVQRGHTVEVRWPYSWIRHPGYAGTLLAALGAALAFRSALALPLVLVLAFTYRFRVRDEEAALERHLGEAWRAYRSRTGAFLPKL